MKEDSQNSPAAGRDMSQEDALHAMAAGADADLPAESDLEGIHAEVDADDRQPAIADFDKVGSPSTAARAAGRRTSAAHTFKRTMIPLLIVVGGLLLLMGGAVAILDATGGLPGADDSGMMGGSLRTVLVYSAFPLGIILLVGAWLFHKETKAQ